MTLIRTSFWNGIATAIRMGVALVINKVLAIYVGPAGYAVIGQFQNAVTIAVTFATGAVNTGVTKLTAELYDQEARQQALWRTAGTIVLAMSIVSSLLLALFSRPLAHIFLGDETLASVFLWLAAALVLISLNALLLAILNGKKEIRRYIVANISGSLLSLVLVATLAWKFGLYGALVALSINQAAMLAVTLQQTLTAEWFNWRFLFGRVDPGHARVLGKFVLMAVVTAIAMPASQIAVRNYLGFQFGWDYAGYWEAAWRISTLYLVLVTTTLSLHYLPRIAEIRSWPELKAEMLSVYKVVMPLVIVSALALYLGRNLLIRVLFTPSFLPMGEIMGWQLAGDVMKIASWLLAYLMIGKGLTRIFIITEIMSGVLFFLLVMLLTHLFGFVGVAMAHLANYTIYSIVVYRLTIATAARRARLFRDIGPVS